MKKLTEEQLDKVIGLINKKIKTQKDIANEMGISKMSLNQILNMKLRAPGKIISHSLLDWYEKNKEIEG
jgi:transcriptional regulator with XRE-family HTH domain